MILELILNIFWYTILDYNACLPNSWVIECKISQEDMEIFTEIDKLDKE